MKIGLVDVDCHSGFPNLALTKISAWHKAAGDSIDWYDPLAALTYDKVYASKVFTFTRDYDYFPDHCEVVKGGTGYGEPYTTLPDEIERIQPDYALYGVDYAVGFLSRGCIRNCPWCIMPRKEGGIRQVSTIEVVSAGRRDVVLLDNNFLANGNDFVAEQLTTARKLNLRIDFNQGLDARLVDGYNANFLAGVRWRRYIRFACDQQSQIGALESAVSKLRRAGYKGDVFVYVLARELDETLERILAITSIDKRITPFCQPYREFVPGYVVPPDLKRLARWCNVQSVRNSIPFSAYRH